MGSDKVKNETNEDIMLEIRDENGVRYEEMKDFSRSLFRDTYFDAFSKTKRLIERNDKYRNENSWKCERIYNIIPFWGERGIGKTSVMRSFLGNLESFDSEEYTKFLRSYEERQVKTVELPDAVFWKKCEFVCLECIDASLLTEKEDIFEIILAKMLERLLNKGNTSFQQGEWIIPESNPSLRYRKNDIYSKIATIHKNLKNVNCDNRRYEGTGAVEILHELSGSLDLRESFKDLIPFFLNIVSKTARNTAGNTDVKKYLVISIDDLDMNKAGYEILEQIHRYFMVPDVLIYITVSGSELLTICEQHFVEPNADEATKNRQRRLTKAYIEKVLPFSNRIYLPGISTSNLNITIAPKNFDIKKTFLWKIARRTRVFFDGCGLKKHFYEPDDIRALVNFYNFLGRMSILTNDYSFDSYRLNVNRLMFDITDRLSDYKLNGKQRETFRDICQMNIGRQGVAFVQYVYDNMSEGKFTRDYLKYGYSYGELLRAIYTFQRECGNEKNLIHCIMALETVLLTDLYQTSLNGKESEREKLKETLLECMAGSVCGSWGNKLVPGLSCEIQGGKKNIAYSWGYVKGSFNSDCKLEYEIDGSSDNLYNCVVQMISDKNFRLVKNLELLFMFITKIQNISDESWFTFEYRKKTSAQELGDGQTNTDLFHTESKDSFELKLCHYRLTFDILGFVINCVQYERCVHKIVREGIIDAIVNNKDINIGTDQKKQLRTLIDQNSWKKDIKKWTEREKTYLPLPIYSTDIMYNILKRVKQKNEKENARIIEKKELLKTLQFTLKNIADELKKEDEFFNTDLSGTKPEDACGASFASAFTNFPIVKAILEWDNMDGFETLFNEVIMKFVGNVHMLEMDNLEGMEDEH